MDIFKRKNIKLATSWDWNCKRVCKRAKGDTQRLHRYSRRKLKQELRNDNNERM